MIVRLYGALLLAGAKLRAHKLRLAITIIISGLLFSILAASIFVGRGFFAGIEQLDRQSLSGRYIIQAYAADILPSFTADDNPQAAQRIDMLYKQQIEAKKMLAKKLGIAYDAQSEPKPVMELPGPSGDTQKIFDINNPLVVQALGEQRAAQPSAGIDELKTIAQPYGAKSFYRSQYISLNTGDTLRALPGNTETYDEEDQEMQSNDTDLGQMWQLIDSSLLASFILPGQSTDVGADGSIPVVIPYDTAEQLTGNEKLDDAAPAAEKLAHLKKVSGAAAGLTVPVCYRNVASNDLIQQAIATQQEIAQHKADKNYTAPALQYGLPAEACGTPTTRLDTRTASQKQQDAKQATFDAAFADNTPVQTPLKLRVIGVSHQEENQKATTVSQLVSSVVGSSLGFGWFSPLETSQRHEMVQKLFYPPLPALYGNGESLYAEFSSANAARTFAHRETCKQDITYDEMNPNAICTAPGKPYKPFFLSTYGSNSLAIENAKQNFSRITGWAAIAIAVVAGIIMMTTVGRTISDSRRETAVFRALGATRTTIAILYVFYTLCMCVGISVFLLILGITLAMSTDYLFALPITTELIVAYSLNSFDLHMQLYSIAATDIAKIIGIVFTAGIAGVLLPLIRNMRRNPIRDMRDEG